MGRFLFVAHAAIGHILPMLSVAALLQRRGHWVGVYCGPAGAELISAQGLVYCAPHAWRADAPLPTPPLQDTRSAAQVAATMLQYRFFGSIEAMTHDIVSCAQLHDAQIIINDVLMPGGGLAAELLGVPWSTMTMCPLPVIETHRHMLGDYFWACFDNQEARQQLGLPPQPGNLLDNISPWLHIVPATANFIGDTRQLPEQVHCVGPLSMSDPTPAPPWAAALRDAPAPILATVSSERMVGLQRTDADLKRYIRAIVEGIADEPVTMIITVPTPQKVTDFGSLPPNVRIEGFVSHEALMPWLAAVITHGGWGSIGRALQHGLPVVTVPFGKDQPLNAARCQELGFGVSLSLRQLTPANIRASVGAILNEPHYRANARAEAARIRELRPVQQAADLFEALLAPPLVARAAGYAPRA